MITLYDPAPTPKNEAMRERSILRSRVLEVPARDDVQAIVEGARRRYVMRMACVSIVFRDWEYVVAASGMALGVHRRSTAFCAHAILTPDDIFCVPDTSVDPRFSGNPAVTDGPRIRFYLGAPLVAPGGIALGALCLIDTKPRPYPTDAVEEELKTLAAQITNLVMQTHRG